MISGKPLNKKNKSKEKGEEKKLFKEYIEQHGNETGKCP